MRAWQAWSFCCGRTRLSRLTDGGTLTRKALAQAAAVEHPTMALTLSRMEREGSISHKPSPPDGRSTVFSLTASAQARLGEVNAVLDDQASVRTGCEGHPSGDAQAVFGRREDPHRAGWAARRLKHCRAMPARRDRREPVLQLAEGVPGGGQEAACRGYGASRHLRRGQGPAP